MRNTNLKSLLSPTPAWTSELTAMDNVQLPARPDMISNAECTLERLNPYSTELDLTLNAANRLASEFKGLPALLPEGADDVITLNLGENNEVARWWLGQKMSGAEIVGSRAAMLDIYLAFYDLKRDLILITDGIRHDFAVADELYSMLHAN